MLRRARQGGELGAREMLEGLLTQPLEQAQGALPSPDLRRIGCRPYRAVQPERLTNAALATEIADAPDRLFGSSRQLDRLLRAAERYEVLEVRPPGEREAAVAAAGTSPADVGLDEGDLGVGRTALELERRPQTGEAAADDADVRRRVALEPGMLIRHLPVERLLEPERASPVGLNAAAWEGDHS